MVVTSVLIRIIFKLSLLSFAASFINRIQKGHSSRIVMTNNEGRRYASYVIYKGKAAATVKIIPPTWQSVSPNSANKYVSREGGLFFEIAPSTAPREYDWTKKINFFLDATECGQLIATAQSDGAEFVHDPNALSDKAGQVTKKMKWTPSNDGKGFFMSLNVADKSNPNSPIQSSYSLPVSWSEFLVLDSIIRYSIPKFLGMDMVWVDQMAGPGGIGTYEAAPSPPPPPAYLNINN